MTRGKAVGWEERIPGTPERLDEGTALGNKKGVIST